jgi:hypothetical protein
MCFDSSLLSFQSPALAMSSSSSIPASLPDLSVAYKLHSECGKLINLYDWLQENSQISFIILVGFTDKILLTQLIITLPF